MFTGLVEGLGRIERLVDERAGRRLTIDWGDLATSEPLKLGESVAVNGCCLTVVAIAGTELRGPGRAGDFGANQPG